MKPLPSISFSSGLAERLLQEGILEITSHKETQSKKNMEEKDKQTVQYKLCNDHIFPATAGCCLVPAGK